MQSCFPKALWLAKSKLHVQTCLNSPQPPLLIYLCPKPRHEVHFFPMSFVMVLIFRRKARSMLLGESSTLLPPCQCFRGSSSSENAELCRQWSREAETANLTFPGLLHHSLQPASPVCFACTLNSFYVYSSPSVMTLDLSVFSFFPGSRTIYPFITKYPTYLPTFTVSYPSVNSSLDSFYLTSPFCLPEMTWKFHPYPYHSFSLSVFSNELTVVFCLWKYTVLWLLQLAVFSFCLYLSNNFVSI